MTKEKQKEEEFITSIILPLSLATLARVEASKLNISRSKYIRQLLIKELEKVGKNERVHG